LKIQDNGTLSQLCLQRGISNFQELANFLRYLPYGRTTSRTNATQLFTENKGTCSSKHGLFKSVAIENNFQEFKLIIGLFKMNNKNTPGIKDALTKFTLDFMPEAHTYIRIGEETLDLTNITSSFENIKSDIIEELEIQPSQIGAFKVDYHKRFLKKWIANEGIPYDFDTVWELRENCISNLSSL